MRDRLPPLFALQAFEAAARLGSFSGAANELKLTPGAISRQIRQLEEWCSLTLFERMGPRVRITHEGRDLLSRLATPLSALHEALYPSAGSAVQTLQIATLVSTTKAWLLSVLAGFSTEHPDIRITLQTDYALVRPPPRVPMVLLRYGLEPGPEFHTELLFEDRLVAVAAPSLAIAIGSDPRYWPPASMLQHLTGCVTNWLTAAGLPTGFVPTGPAFNDADIMLDAAELGIGVALCRLSLAFPRLDAGRLILASDTIVPSPLANLMIVRHECRELPAVQRFTRWLLPEARKIGDMIKAFDNA